MPTAPDHQVLIVGAGFSGIGTAIALDRAGITDWRILEDGEGVGGTWYWNTYPGVAVDIPSFSYQFSFDQRTDWSRTYAPGEELRRYAEDCVRRHGLRDRIRFATRVERATFDDDDRLWHIRTTDGTTTTARFLVNACGVLTTPKLPDIPGVGSFAGTTLHTARWDHDVDLAGARVAVIGTGASAVQLIPAIAPEVGELTVFQRTPIWCFPKPDLPLPDGLRRALRVPGARRLARLASQAFVELTFPLAAHFHSALHITAPMERLGRAWLRSQVSDPDVREQLTPRYPLGCKRPSFHNTYLSTYDEPHVHLVTDRIEAITPTGIRTADGTSHDVDVLVLATGFATLDVGAMPTFELVGADGTTLTGFWQANRLQAYEGVSVPGFPNFFTVFGPYGYNGSSYFALIEAQTHHIVRCLRHAAARGADRVEVTAEANARFWQSVLDRRHRQVFWQEGCAAANSYYFDAHGDVPLRPSTTAGSWVRSRRFDLDDYRFDRAA